MSVGFRAVQWNRAKRVYDAILLGAVGVYLLGFHAVEAWSHLPADRLAWVDLRLRAFGTAAFLMLTVILCIGPAARLDARVLPALYNRRHFGVATFFVALLHAAFMVEWYWLQDSLPNIVTELTNWPAYGRFIGFPFKALGLAALLVLLAMAATSHDYWLAVLTPPVWKALHMALYGAYGLVVMHVALGAMQRNHSPAVPALLLVCFGLVAAVHLLAARRERRRDLGTATTRKGWLVVGEPRSIPEGAARVVKAPDGERIAVFRDGARIGAVSSLCAHQNGPIGEGRIVDGCIVCPWHGYQYRLEDGCAPPPFTEKLATFRVRLRRGVVEVDPRPLPPGTPAAIRWEA